MDNMTNKKLNINPVSKRSLYFNQQLGIRINKKFDNSFWNEFKKRILNSIIVYLIISGLLHIFIHGFDLPVNNSRLFTYTLLFSVLNIFFIYKLSSIIIVLIVIFYYGRFIYNNIIELSFGINTIYNIVIREVDYVMPLPFVRTYEESYSYREEYLTSFLIIVSLCFTLISLYLVNRRKAYFFFILSSVLVIEFSIYLTDDFNILYIGYLLLGFLLYLYVKRADNNSINKSKKNHNFKIKKNRIIFKNYNISKLPIFRFVLFISIIILITGSVVSKIIPEDYYDTNSYLKNKTDQIVYNVAWKGFEVFNNKNDLMTNGGMDHGAFGNVPSIVYDNQPDLEVTFVQYTTDPIYLPTFSGTIYDNNNRRWINDNGYVNSGYHTMFYNFTNKFLQELYYTNYNISYIDVVGNDNLYNSSAYEITEDTEDKKKAPNYKTGQGIMFIENIGIEESDFNVWPYYYCDNYNKPTVFYNRATKVPYYSILYDYDEIEDLKNDYTNYTGHGFQPAQLWSGSYTIADQVPTESYNNEDLSEIKNFCKEHDIVGKTPTEVIDKIKNLYSNEYSYTLSPGSTPEDEDYAMYFLEETQRGFCVHFASAACLMLRANGIPARYVEGYIINSEAYKTARHADVKKDYDINPEEMYVGYSNTFQNIQPITVTLSDKNAHAWVEVYYFNYGWVPVEFTVGYYDQEPNLIISNTNLNNNVEEKGFLKFIHSKPVTIIKNTVIYLFKNYSLLMLIIFILIIYIYKFTYIYKFYYTYNKKRAENQYKFIEKLVMQELIKKDPKYSKQLLTHEYLLKLLYKEFNFLDKNTVKLIRGYEQYLYDKNSRNDQIDLLTIKFNKFIKDFTKNCNMVRCLWIRFLIFKINKKPPKWVRQLIINITESIKNINIKKMIHSS